MFPRGFVVFRVWGAVLTLIYAGMGWNIVSETRNGLEIQETGWKVGEVGRGQTSRMLTQGFGFYYVDSGEAMKSFMLNHMFVFEKAL